MSIPIIQIGHFSDTCEDLPENFKIRSAYLKHLPRLGDVIPDISLIPIKNTVDVGFNLSEAITNPEATNRIILVGNYAPPDNPNGTDNNVRKEFYAATVEFAGRKIPIVSTLNGFELSYIKSAVTGLYVIKSDNGDQFRSLTLAPQKGIEFSDARLREALVDTGAITPTTVNEIPNVPDESHIVHIDNFRNVKAWFSAVDYELLANAAQKKGEVEITFLRQSIDPHCHIKAHDKKSLGTFTAEPRPTLFKGRIGEKIVAERSSSFYIDGRSVPQIVELRMDPVREHTTFPIPHVGQCIHVRQLG